MPTTAEHDRQLSDAAALQVAHILESSDLQEIAQLNWVEQIQYFVTERSHLINQVPLLIRLANDLIGLISARTYSNTI